MTNTFYKAAAPIRKNNKAEVDITIISPLHPPRPGYFVEVDIDPGDIDEVLKEKARAKVKAAHEKAIKNGNEQVFLWGKMKDNVESDPSS